MFIYFDTEFTGLRKDTTLVSIGLVAESGRSFYAEFSDWDKTYKDEWFQENVVKHLLYGTDKWSRQDRLLTDYVYGTKEKIRDALKAWFQRFNKVELISDVCHYDMVLLIDVFGTAFDLPENVSPVCHDVNSDIARWANIDEREAFDMSREELIEILGHHTNQIIGDKHNSLYDADVIRAIYRGIRHYESCGKNYQYVKLAYEQIMEERGE